MLDLNLWFFTLAIPAAIFAGVSKGGFGSGAAFASASILALVIEPRAALGIMLPLLIIIDFVTLRPYWRKWSWPDAKVLMIGGVPGVLLGAALFRVAEPDLLRILIGVISLLFVGWQLAQRAGMVVQVRNRLPVWIGLLSGVGAGFTSFISHAGGPIAAVYLLTQRLDKLQYQATTVLVFWANNLIKAVPYGFLGLFTAETLTANLFLAPFAVLGAWLGVRAHFLVPERVFFGVTYVLLTLTGGKLIWDGFT